MVLDLGRSIASGRAADGAPARAPRTLHVDGVALDREGMVLRVDGRRLPLTPQEFLLLNLLMEHAGCVLTRQELLDRIWGPGRGRDSNTLVVFASRLRRKLRRPDGSSRLRTVCAVGYVFDESAD
jgi:DNA-binding response OmpR family regulator